MSTTDIILTTILAVLVFELWVTAIIVAITFKFK